MTQKRKGNLLATLKRRADLNWIKKFKSTELYLVGGSVRDLILKRVTHDYDFVVRGLDLKSLKRQLQKLGQVDYVGKRFGVFKLTPRGMKITFDIALPRTERSMRKQGGHRDFEIVSDGDLPIAEDLKRRDFTINALAVRWSDGKLIDEHGGISDIATRTIRTVGSPASRFQEDHIRMLRAIRFASQLDFAIESQTMNSIKRLARKLGKSVVPREPMAIELVKAFRAQPVRALDLLADSRLLPVLIPEITSGPVVRRARLSLEKLVSPLFAKTFPGYRPSSRLIFATLLHEVRSAGIVRRLKLTNASSTVQPSHVGWLTQNYPQALGLGSKMSRVTLERLYFREDDPDGELLKLSWLVAQINKKSKPLQLKQYRLTVKLLHLLAPRGKLPKKLITGQDIVKLGQAPGQRIAKILETVREAQLAKKVTTRRQAMALAKKNLNQ